MSAHRHARVIRIGRWSVVTHPRTVAVTVVIVGATALLAVVAMMLGSMPISFDGVVAAVFGASTDARATQVVTGVRFPRVLTAIAAGAALGVSGAIFQSVSRNALGSPDVIGFTTGAATGAILQIVVFGGGPLEVAAGAVLGGVGTALIVYLASLRGGVTGGYRLVLIGIGVGATLEAVNNLLIVWGNIDNAVAANIWLAGSLETRTWQHALPVTIGTLLLVPVAGALARRADLMGMGDDAAAQLGVRVERTRIGLVFVAVVLAALATGAAGPIAFVALAAPQIVTRLTRASGMPVGSAAAMGAGLLVLADVAARALPITANVPIGRVTGIVGGIYLIWLLTRTKQV